MSPPPPSPDCDTLFAFYDKICNYYRSSKCVHQRTASCITWTIIIYIQLCTGTLHFSAMSAWIFTLTGSDMSYLTITLSESDCSTMFGIVFDNRILFWRLCSITSLITPFKFVHSYRLSFTASSGASWRRSNTAVD